MFTKKVDQGQTLGKTQNLKCLIKQISNESLYTEMNHQTKEKFPSRADRTDIISTRHQNIKMMIEVNFLKYYVSQMKKIKNTPENLGKMSANHTQMNSRIFPIYLF